MYFDINPVFFISTLLNFKVSRRTENRFATIRALDIGTRYLFSVCGIVTIEWGNSSSALLPRTSRKARNEFIVANCDFSARSPGNAHARTNFISLSGFQKVSTLHACNTTNKRIRQQLSQEWQKYYLTHYPLGEMKLPP